jgi:Flp pilus assembly protein TadD
MSFMSFWKRLSGKGAKAAFAETLRSMPPEEALKVLETAAEMDPDDHWAWHNRGVALQKLGRSEEAIASFRRAAELNPMNTFAWESLGKLLRKTGRHDEAVQLYKRGIESWPEGAGDLWNGLGIAYIELNRYADALPCFDHATRLHSKDGSVWNNKGWALENLGRFDEARTAYEEGQRLGAPIAGRNLEALREAGH